MPKPLTLKGGVPLKGAGVKKKKSKKDNEGNDPAEQEREQLEREIHGYSLEGQQQVDRRTEAEKKHEARLGKLEEERLKKVAVKSHKDKVKEFNEYLANLSEHHDIPKVGPG